MRGGCLPVVFLLLALVAIFLALMGINFYAPR